MNKVIEIITCSRNIKIIFEIIIKRKITITRIQKKKEKMSEGRKLRRPGFINEFLIKFCPEEVLL